MKLLPVTFSALALVWAGATACAVDYQPDSGFSGDGKAFGPFPSIRSARVANRTNGGYLLGGSLDVDFNLDWAVARFQANGELDGSFSVIGGRSVVFDLVAGGDDALLGAFELADGKTLLLGTAETSTVDAPALARLNVNGATDATFGVAGKRVITAVPWPDADLAFGAVVRQADGKFVFGGTCDSCPDDGRAVALRVSADGVPDASFGTNGWATIAQPLANPELRSMTIDARGRVVLAGRYASGGLGQPLLVRFTTAGQADASFGGAGHVIVSTLPDPADGGWGANALVADHDGSLVLAVGSLMVATADHRTGLLRLRENGTVDSGFGGGFLNLTTALGSSLDAIALRSDGRVVTAGWSQSAPDIMNFYIVRALANGTRDISFDGGAGANGAVTIAMAADTDSMATSIVLSAGKPVIAGEVVGTSARIGLLRLNSDLIFTGTFD